MLFKSKELVYTYTMVEPSGVFNTGDEVTLSTLDDYLKVTADNKRQWILYYHHITKVEYSNKIMKISYLNSLKQEHIFVVEDPTGKGKKLANRLKNK